MAAALSAALAAAAGASGAPPNLVFIMADDLEADWKDDRAAYMPHLKRRLKDGGTQFVNHVAVTPQCGPSRTSILTGRVSHNNGYVFNGDPASMAAFALLQNNTVGRWLRDAGYHTAMLGKYVWGTEGGDYAPRVPGRPDLGPVPPRGWSHYGGFLQTYQFYNASMYDMDWADGADAPDPEPVVRVMTGRHQSEFLGELTVAEVNKAVSKGKPFFIHVTPVMPHWGPCTGPTGPFAPDDPKWEFDLVDDSGKKSPFPISPCPTTQNKHKFDGQGATRVPDVWNVSIAGARPGPYKHFAGPGRMTAWQALRGDYGWRNRSASLLDLDDMIGVIFSGLDDAGVNDSTYVFFSSDNGYHIGEYKMPFSKGWPYDTDCLMPMYVSGPGVAAGATLAHPTTHVDITATLVDLAGARAGGPLDGQSFAKELAQGGAGADAWRQFSFSEFFFRNNITWRMVRVVNSTHKLSYVYWCDGTSEFFDLGSDPFQMRNLAPVPAMEELAGLANALSTCHEAGCISPQPTPGPATPLSCAHP